MGIPDGLPKRGGRALDPAGSSRPRVLGNVAGSLAKRLIMNCRGYPGNVDLAWTNKMRRTLHPTQIAQGAA
jgi:hypothetical protein